jgi:hypothetical protein
MKLGWQEINHISKKRKKKYDEHDHILSIADKIDHKVIDLILGVK